MILLLGVDGPAHEEGSVWKLRAVASSEPPPNHRGFGPVAKDAWVRAHRSFYERSRRIARLPVIRGIVPYASLKHRRADLPEPVELDGGSYGLAFALHFASESFGAPPDILVAATGEVLKHGKVGRVDGIFAKVSALVEWSRRTGSEVEAILVPQSQTPEELASLSSFSLRVVPVDTVEEAIASAFPSRFACIDEHDRSVSDDLVDEWFAASVDLSGNLPDWAALAISAGACASVRSNMSESVAWQLRFVEAIASRHQGFPMPVDLPPWNPRVVETFVAEHRCVIAAHYVQHNADLGFESPEVIEPSRQLLPASPVDDMPAHRRLRGALARHEAMVGSLESAMETQARLTRAWLQSGAPDEASFPLSEWLRLAGALGDSVELARALEAAGSYHRRIPTGALGRAYVCLGALRGALALRDLALIEKLLHSDDGRRLNDGHRGLRVCRLRYVAAIDRASGRTGAREQLEAMRVDAHDPSDQSDIDVQLVLIELDRIEALPSSMATDRSADELAERLGSMADLARQLLERAPQGDLRWKYVLRRFPY